MKKNLTYKIICGSCVIFLSCFVLNNQSFGIDGTEQKILTEQQTVSVPVYKDSKGNFIIKTDDLRDESLGYGYVCPGDANNDGKLILDKRLVNGEHTATVDIIQATDCVPTQMQTVHIYTNFKENMKYTVTEPAQPLLNTDNDSDRDIEDIKVENHKKETFNNTIYIFKDYEILLNPDTKTVTLNILYEYQ